MTRALNAIIFDFDGVIADSERLHLLAYRDVLAPLGLELGDEDYFAEYLGHDDRGVFRTYARIHGLTWDDQTIAHLIEKKGGLYDDLSARGEMLFPGAAAFIRDAAKAVPIAIASGALTHEIDDILERAQLRGLFEAVVGADQTARSKPSPDPYWEAFHRINVRGRDLDPARTVAIEDSRWGLASAATAGLRCVAVTNTYTADQLSPHAELVVSGLNALTIDALETLCASPLDANRAAAARRPLP